MDNDLDLIERAFSDIENHKVCKKFLNLHSM